MEYTSSSRFHKVFGQPVLLKRLHLNQNPEPFVMDTP
jgi:hypothetical protein